MLATTAVQDVPIKNVWQSGLNDVTFVATVGDNSQRELRKINKDFADSYQFDKTTVQIKEPFKLRMTGKVKDQEILFVVNGGRKLIKIQNGVNLKQDVSKAPGKRQTAFDFGLLPDHLFNNYFQAKFVRNDRATGMPVYDVTYVSSLNDKTRHRIWVDASKKHIVKREWYSQIDGRLMATFDYTGGAKVNNVWIPGKVTVKNSEGKVAGTMTYSSVKVNSGLADSLFNF